MLTATLFIQLSLVLAITVIHDGHSEDWSYVRGCYYTNWAQYRPGNAKYFPENYQSGLCTHLFYAFAVMDSNYHIKEFEWNDFDMYKRFNRLKLNQPGLKTLISFGGWTYSEQNKALVKRMMSSKETRSIFIHSACNYVRDHGFDGFDLDYEYPDADEKQNYALLLEEMSQQFTEHGYLLTAAVSAAISKIDAGYDIPVMARTLDFVNLMSYDLHGAWESKTGFNSPLYDCNNDQLSINDGASHWVSKGLPKEQLIIGLASYGRAWTLTNPTNQSGVGAPGSPGLPGPYTREPGFLSFYEKKSEGCSKKNATFLRCFLLLILMVIGFI